MREGSFSYRQLRSPRSLASGYDCVALRANYKDTMPDAALDVISIATGIDLRKAKMEDNTMKKKMSTFERVFRVEGRVEGRDKTILEFIQGKRDYHVPDIQIREELLKFFKLDEEAVKRYMEAGLAKA